jgi:hypothetical protein
MQKEIEFIRFAPISLFLFSKMSNYVFIADKKNTKIVNINKILSITNNLRCVNELFRGSSMKLYENFLRVV